VQRNKSSIEYKLPIISDYEKYNLMCPKLYGVYTPVEKDLVTTSFMLTPNWVYSGDIDSYVNLKRAAGYIQELPYKHKWLKSDVSATSSTNLRFLNELEALTYVYDHMPYIARFGGEKWLFSLLNLNKEGATLSGWRPEIHPMKLRSCEHIEISSENIPFEIEGHLIITSVERLLQVTNFYRSASPLEYYYGDSDSPKSVLLNLLMEKAGMEDDHIKKILSEYNVDAIVDIIRNAKEKEVMDSDPSEVRDPIEKVAFYYASTSERERMKKERLVSEQDSVIISTSAELGFRSIFYKTYLDLAERSEANEQLQRFYDKEDKILEEFNNLYNYNIKRCLDNFFKDSNDALEGSEGEDFFDGFFEEQEEYDLPDVEESGGAPVFIEDNDQWINRTGDVIGSGRKVWDPGGIPDLIDEETPRSSSLITLL